MDNIIKKILKIFFIFFLNLKKNFFLFIMSIFFFSYSGSSKIRGTCLKNKFTLIFCKNVTPILLKII